MRIRTSDDMARLLRERRRELGLDQAELAVRVGVSRKWIVEVERGKPGAEIGLVLRTLNVLGLQVRARPDATPEGTSSADTVSVDIDRIVDDARDGDRD